MNGRRVVMAVVTMACAAAPVLMAQDASVSVYQSGSAFVRRTFVERVTAGTSSHAVDFGVRGLDPGALVPLDDGLAIVSSRVSAAAGQQASLLRSVGRDLDFGMPSGDSVRYRRGTLLSLDPVAVRMNGRVQFSMPGQPAFPDSLAVLTPRVDLVLNAARALPSLRLGFFADGLSWRTSYTVVVPRVGGGPAIVGGTASIDNGALALRNAQVQLVSGEIRRAQVQRSLATPRDMAVSRPGALRVEAITVSQPEAVAEVRTYTLPGRVDFTPGTMTSAALFAPASAEVQRLFRFEPRRPLMGDWQSAPDSNLHPQVAYRVRRPAGSPFGDVPLPEGVARVFAPDAEGRLQLLGEQHLGETPRGRDIELVTGSASDVFADRTQTAFERRNDRDVTVTVRTVFHNDKDESVTVEVNEFAPGRWEVQNSTVPPERVSDTQFRFNMPVPAHSVATLEYRVRVRW